MYFQRVFTEGLAQTSFMIGPESSPETIVIDPRRDVQVYLDLAAASGRSISHIFETHIHADFASGARELAERTGARLLLSAIGESDFPHDGVDDGDEFEVGDLRVSVLLTPGHTPEHISILVRDTSQPGDPPLLFTGDALFVGAVGRPDLLGEEQTQALAHALYDTIHSILIPLDDDIIVYPGHGAGSACGKAIGDAPSTTMGQEKRFNYAFRPMDETTFVKVILEDLPDTPPYFPVMKRLNKRGPAILNGIPQPPERSVEEVRDRVSGATDGVTLLDVRNAETFSQGFLRGALNIGLGPNLSNWAGWAVSYDRPILLIVGDADDVEEAVTWLVRIGLDTVEGYSIADPDGWRAAGMDVLTVGQLRPSEAEDRIRRDGIQILDVRNDDEWEMGHVAGAHHVPVGYLANGARNGLDPEQPVAVMCAAGYRSSLGTSVLKSQGFDEVYNIVGGMDAWLDAGLEVER